MKIKGTIEQLKVLLSLGTIDVYPLNKPDFVDFGEDQTIPWGQAQSYELQKKVALYLVVAESLDPNRVRKYIAVPLANELFK